MFLRLIILVPFLFFSGCNAPTEKVENSAKETPVVIGVSLASYKVERWKRDIAYISERAASLNAKVITLVANDDPKLQVFQAKNLIMQGVNVLLVVAVDSSSFSEVVETAHKAGVKVIAYDRLLKDCNLDVYLTFDNVKVGQYQAENVLNKIGGKGNIVYIGGSPTDNNAHLVKAGSFKVLQPKIDQGDVKVVFSEFVPNWDSKEAYQLMEKYLKSDKNIQGVVAANDSTALGVIQALAEVGLAGKIPVSGQDATLSACQRIVEGTQSVTVYKPIKSLAYAAAETAVALAKKQPVAINGKTNNGKIDVDSILLDVVAVTAENMDEVVVKDGFQPRDQIYQNVAELKK